MADRIAVVALVVNDENKVLVVWNKRYGKWGLPGGKLEEGETIGEALRREVLEETGRRPKKWWWLYKGLHGESVESDRATFVYVFRAILDGVPVEAEPGCPVTWFTHDEFIRWGLAPAFYAEVFKALEAECKADNAPPACPI